MKLNYEKIIQYINKMMFYHDIPGLAVGIGQDFQLIFEEGFGYKNIETKEKVKKDTIFHMASVTKLFVGTAIMQLMEKGLVDIHAPVKRYVPYFEISDPRHEPITVMQMLSHTSGMPDCDDYEWENPKYDEMALENYVRSQVQENLQLLWNPGEKFAYSNIAYEILGDLISKVSNQPFEEYIKDNIFKPLGMNDSSLLTFERSREEIAAPHIKNDKKEVEISKVFPYNRAHGPSSTLTSNLQDILIWASVHLNKGIFNGCRILQEDTYKTMWEPVTMINSREQICLSWFSRKHEKLTLYGHEGSDIGFRSSFAIIPEKKMHISVHANIQTAPTRRIQKGILDILLGNVPEIK